jgi:hypothetical protein
VEIVHSRHSLLPSFKIIPKLQSAQAKPHVERTPSFRTTKPDRCENHLFLAYVTRYIYFLILGTLNGVKRFICIDERGVEMIGVSMSWAIVRATRIFAGDKEVSGRQNDTKRGAR